MKSDGSYFLSPSRQSIITSLLSAGEFAVSTARTPPSSLALSFFFF